MESFDPVTPQGLTISNLFVLELVISGLLMSMVIIWLGVSLVRFRARPQDATEPPQVRGNRTLELIWTVTPALVLAVVFVLVVQTIRTVDAAAPGAQPLRVIGHQWWWEYDYPNSQVVTANELHVPVGVPLQISLESGDVIHSFHVPRFGWMQDMVPGKTNQMSVLVNRPGVYDGTCNQYCGLQHAWMRIRVIAEPGEQFTAWQQQQSQPTVPAGSRGEQVFLQNTCVACHAIRGLQTTASVGPDLTHVGSRATLGAGVVDNTPANLEQWIRDPQALKPGVLMPAFQNLSPADLTALADYLESLK
ncbi:MAG: cytochrome c oxidase subunit II [Chloroflexota bacterium]|nr:cytochrome c oxidase subunit II [Chloroflexota bacterium]